MCPDLTSEEIAIAIDQMVPQWYFDINHMTALDYGFWDPENPETETWDFGEDTYIRKYTQGLPTLSVPPASLGIRVKYDPEPRRTLGVDYRSLYGWTD